MPPSYAVTSLCAVYFQTFQEACATHHHCHCVFGYLIMENCISCYCMIYLILTAFDMKMEKSFAQDVDDDVAAWQHPSSLFFVPPLFHVLITLLYWRAPHHSYSHAPLLPASLFLILQRKPSRDICCVRCGAGERVSSSADKPLFGCCGDIFSPVTYSRRARGRHRRMMMKEERAVAVAHTPLHRTAHALRRGAHARTHAASVCVNR